jgi:16S rRNA (guanine1207-N2)-methyltransferase
LLRKPTRCPPSADEGFLAGANGPGQAHPEHYFSASPSAPSEPTLVSVNLPGLAFSLLSDRGVFSGRRVDPGTMALLEQAPAPPAEGDLLDLGCGYGPVACTLAKKSPAATVWAVDVNSRALQLAKENAKRLCLPNVRVAHPEAVPATIRFAAVWSNPPVRVGKQALQQMLSYWLSRLSDHASAWLVISRHLGGDSLASWLTGQGWSVRRAASKSGYRVIEVHRP